MNQRFCGRDFERRRKVAAGTGVFLTADEEAEMQKKTHKSVQSCTHTANMHKHTWNHRALIHIETPFKVDSSGLSVDVENYCSDLTTTCTIKTPACGLGAGIFIPCGNRPYKHTDMQTELQAARNIFIRKHVQRACMPACF